MQVTIATVLTLCTMLTHSRTHNPPHKALFIFSRTLETSPGFSSKTLETLSRTILACSKISGTFCKDPGTFKGLLEHIQGPLKNPSKDLGNILKDNVIFLKDLWYLLKDPLNLLNNSRNLFKDAPEESLEHIKDHTRTSF